MDIKKVAVAGAGLMGCQIALNTAIHGFDVNLTDNSSDAIMKAKNWADGYLDERIAKGKMTREQTDETRARFHLIGDLKTAVADIDLVIEAIVEVEDIKMNFFKELDGYINKDTIIATNSSRLVSSTFKDCVSNPSRLANLHYFHPALVMKLVEVVQGEHCSDETIKALMDFCVKTNKAPIHLRKEIDGFLVNRILGAIEKEAWYLISEGVCTYKEYDMGQELGLNHPMGIFRMIDFTGVDLAYNQKQRACELSGVKDISYEVLKEMYDKGELGVKTGKGFYDYPDNKK